MTSPRSRQRGVVLLVMLTVMILGGLYLLVSKLGQITGQRAAETASAAALAQAKEALLAYAVMNYGALPCPDILGNGIASASCNTGALNDGISKIGRLPWQTLGLPDLRDGAGECLWYAVSGSYKINPTAANLNSDLNGQFNVLDNSGTVYLAGGSTPASAVTRAVAVLFAPGVTQGAQNRGGGPATRCGNNTTASNYLDSKLTSIGLINNAPTLFTAGAPTTFIAADLSSTFTDRLLFITPQQLWPAVERRIAREAKQCLDSYASANGNKYPWAAIPPTYGPSPYVVFGHISTIPNVTGFTTIMSTAWPIIPAPGCLFSNGILWPKWRDLVFYEVAPDYAPNSSATCTSACLTLNTTPNKRAMIIVAGRRLASQPTPRPNANPLMYLEGANNNTTDLTSVTGPTSSTFNDVTVCVDGVGASATCN